MDWADNIVHNMIIGTCESSLEPAYGPHSKIAAALRKAKADGMREATDVIEKAGGYYAPAFVEGLRSRASQIEKGQT